MVQQLNEAQSRLTILRRRQVQDRTGLGRSTLYAQIKAGVFPSPICLGGGRSVGWVESEIEDWLKRQIAASRSVGT